MSNAVRIGADDVLTRIDVPVGWRWFLPILNRGLGCSAVVPRSWRAPSTAAGFHAVLRSRFFAPVPDETTHCRFRNALVQGGVHDDLPAGVCRQIGDHGPKRCKMLPTPRQPYRAEEVTPDDPPDDPDVHFSVDAQARWVKKGSKPTPNYKMTSNGFARPNEESFIDKVPPHICEPGRPAWPPP
ncbi:MAG: hypothetical protein GDA36_12060 [Rhodobacteraceae bacterium]|nr:hypothetical protein [Paracoccaceae bacterium]